MTVDEFKNVKSTFPWRYQIVKGNITIFDKHNRIVDLLTMIELVIFISKWLENKDGDQHQ